MMACLLQTIATYDSSPRKVVLIITMNLLVLRCILHNESSCPSVHTVILACIYMPKCRTEALNHIPTS